MPKLSWIVSFLVASTIVSPNRSLPRAGLLTEPAS